MRNYLHYSWYYFLALLESIPNFLCSLMGIYPKFDFSTNFLVGQTISRVGSIISDRDMDRMSKIHDADEMVSEAKQLLSTND